MTKVTFKGKEVRLSGSLPKIGMKAPSFELVDQSLKDVTLESLGQKKKLLNIFVSLDTSVCSKSLHAFFEKCASTDAIIANISLDLPFAAKRFCQNEGVEKAVTLSAFRSRFPDDYGLRILGGPLKGLCARAVLVLNEENKVLYLELVSEITEEPNYTKAIEALES